MSKFICVFSEDAAKDMERRGYELFKYDARNQIWTFFNKDPESRTFTADYQVMLSDVVSF